MKVTDTHVFFWKEFLSQWHKSPFTINGITYNCPEQYMMHQKSVLFGDDETGQNILATDSPREQKALGRLVKNFRYDIWAANAKNIVYNGNKAKFLQNPDLLEKLMSYGTRKFVEASPADTIWGIGMGEDHFRIEDEDSWVGTNWLGEVLSELRDDFLAAEQCHNINDMVRFTNTYKPVDVFKTNKPAQLPVGTVITLNHRDLAVISVSDELEYKYIDYLGEEWDCEYDDISEANDRTPEFLQQITDELEGDGEEAIESLVNHLEMVTGDEYQNLFNVLDMEFDLDNYMSKITDTVKSRLKKD